MNTPPSGEFANISDNRAATVRVVTTSLVRCCSRNDRASALVSDPGGGVVQLDVPAPVLTRDSIDVRCSAPRTSVTFLMIFTCHCATAWLSVIQGIDPRMNIGNLRADSQG